ncbi:MAG: hypothetical protein HKL95_05170, partial [Phycisphaerae bacterium]|nr:hypothetical protein [Phycisphaerae bacterium]
MIQASTPGSFSAIVRMELHVAGQHIALAQMGGGRLLFDHPVALADEAGE